MLCKAQNAAASELIELAWIVTLQVARPSITRKAGSRPRTRRLYKAYKAADKAFV